MVLLGNFREIEQMHRLQMFWSESVHYTYIFCILFRFVLLHSDVIRFAFTHTHTRTHTPIQRKHLDSMAEICMRVLTSFFPFFFFVFFVFFFCSVGIPFGGRNKWNSSLAFFSLSSLLSFLCLVSLLHTAYVCKLLCWMQKT